MTGSPVDPLFLELQEALVGRYSLERELGRGGMGIVFLAREVALDRLVAIKLLPPALADYPDLKGRFLREAQIAARLSHPNIVPIHAVETAGQLVWFVMAFVPGETLGHRLRERGSLPVGDTCRILRDAAWALAHAHAHGVVHRDVKPDNILLESGGRRALLVDFGIAAPVQDGSGDGRVFGTVGYLSPEQARGDAVDGRSDLYALGVVAYHALSGKLPYTARSLEELVDRQLAGTPVSLASMAPHVPRVLCRAVDRCLAGYPTARFQTGEELAEALEQLQTAPTDLPAPLRVWLSQGKISKPATFVSVFYGVPFLVAGLVSPLMGGPLDMAAALLGVGGASIAASWGAYGLIRTHHTRRLFRAGYTHDDILQAMDVHIEKRREELAFEHGVVPTTAGRLVNSGVKATAAVSGLGLVAMTLLPAPLVGVGAAVAVAAGMSSVALFLLRFFVPGARSGTRDRKAELARRFWNSAIGRTLSAAARWKLRAPSAPDEVLHRPTEVALGQAADALYKALPAAQRKDLRQLPEQITYLAGQAAIMRAKLEELDDLIAKADPETLFGAKPAGDGGAAELRAARELWAGQLRETVTMLESLRLGLLRLHAGSAQPSELTAELDAARLLRERLLLLHEAQAEVP